LNSGQMPHPCRLFSFREGTFMNSQSRIRNRMLTAACVPPRSGPALPRGLLILAPVLMPGWNVKT